MRRYDRYKYPPPGTEGGDAGGASKFVIKAGTEEETLTPAAGKFDSTPAMSSISKAQAAAATAILNTRAGTAAVRY